MFAKWMMAAAALAIGAAPAAAQPGGEAQLEADAGEASAWIAKVSDAIVTGSSGFARISPQVNQLFAGVRTPADAKAVAPKVRALLEEARAAVAKGDAMIAALPSLRAQLAAHLDTRQVVADARTQNARTLAMIGHLDDLLVGMETGDRRKMDAAAPKMMESGVLLVEGQALIFRNRQASVPPSDSAHQTMGIAHQLYLGMTAAMRSWYQARVPSKASEAAGQLNEQLAAIAREAAALSRAGRANVVRELVEIEAAAKEVAKGGTEAQLVEKSRLMLLEEEKTFALGEELARWAQANAGLTGAALANQKRPELLPALTAFEERFMAISLAQSAIFTGSR